MAPYSETQQRHRRLSCLIVLSEAQDYRCGDSLMREIVHDYVPSTLDQIRSELMWLRDQNLITLRDIAGVFMATITKSGLDVASGQLVNPGVHRPSPKS